MKKGFSILTIIAVFTLSLLLSCIPAQQPNRATSTSATPFTPTETVDASSARTSAELAELYDVLPGETLQRLPDGGEDRIYPGLHIGVGVHPPDPDSEPGQKWSVGLWLANEQCHGVRGRRQFAGDTFQFFGYSIRVVDIQSEFVVVGISGTSLPPEDAEEFCLSSIYNRLPSEVVVDIYNGSYVFNSITFYKSDEIWTEEYINEQGMTVIRPAAELTIVSDNGTTLWSGNIHEEDILELENYRIQVSSVNDTFIMLIIGEK
jgi:hypothetical protein